MFSQACAIPSVHREGVCLGGLHTVGPLKYTGYYRIRSTSVRYVLYWNAFLFYNYRPQRSWAKVIFSQVSVCPRRGSASVHAGIYPPGTRPPPLRDQIPPETRPPRHQTPPPAPDPPAPRPDPPPDQTPPDPTTPQGRILQHTVNKRPVRILLECILVL